MLLAVIPIGMLGMIFGVPGGLAASAFATGAFLVWAATLGHPDPLDYLDDPVAFFTVGFVTGNWARGALGDHDLRTAAANRRLCDAMARGEVVMHYQPIVRAAGGEVAALEALARWRSRDRLIPPADFIPTASRDPQTTWELTLHTLDAAVRDASGWEAQGDLQVAVNLMPVVLERSELPDAIAETLGRHRFPPHRLVIEVTESALADGEPAVLEALAAIRTIGVGAVAIDDFGIGHSSLARLDRLPVNMLKIDLELVQRIGHAHTSQIIEAIIRMSSALDLMVVGEGVEDADTHERLAGLGCDAIQGFFISRPMPPDEVPGWLGRARVDGD